MEQHSVRFGIQTNGQTNKQTNQLCLPFCCYTGVGWRMAFQSIQSFPFGSNKHHHHHHHYRLLCWHVQSHYEMYVCVIVSVCCVSLCVCVLPQCIFGLLRFANQPINMQSNLKFRTKFSVLFISILADCHLLFCQKGFNAIDY